MPAAEDALLELSYKLTPEAPASATDTILRRLASERLTAVAERRVLNELRRRTSIPVSTLVAELSTYRQKLPANREPPWTSTLIRNDKGAILPIAKNVEIALLNDRAWHGVLWFDEFHQQPWIKAKPPWATRREWKGPRPFTDADESRVLLWMQENGIYCGPEAVRSALEVVIDDMPFHPIRDFLSGTKWDGRARLNLAPTYYFGVKPIFDYTEHVFAKWMISAVARVFQPGCMAKYCLILEGPQDLKKSMALDVLGNPWFTDDVAQLGTKDSQMQVGNAWIVELAELDSINRADINAIKAFISRRVDRFRRPFGRHVIAQERQCVLAGTVNPMSDGYFKDETGNVQFWPLACTAIDIAALRNDRTQLWAEAVHRYRADEAWWLDDEMHAVAGAEQEKRLSEEVWQPIIDGYLRDQPPRNGERWVTLYEVMRHGVGIETAQMKNVADQKRVAGCLRKAGWTRRRDSGGARAWKYRPVEE